MKKLYSKTIKQKETREFPKLMKDGDLIVLFSALKMGTVLVSDDPSLPVGNWSRTWDMSDFEDYDEAVVLQMKEAE